MEPQSLMAVLQGALVAGLLFVGMLAISWALGKRQWFSIWIKRPFQFFSLSATIWLFFRISHLSSIERYAAALTVAAAVGGAVHIIVSFLFTVFFSRKRDIHLPPLLRNVILAVTYIAILLVALKTADPNFSLSPLLVASGVLSLVLGLALQDVLSNLIAGVTLSVEKPLRTDDWVQVEGQEGKVVEITWRTTKILTRQNDYIIYPNRLIAEKALCNLNYPSSLHWEFIQVGLPYSTLPSIAEEALLEAASRVPGVLSKPHPRVFLLRFDDSAILYGLSLPIEDYDNSRLILSDVRKEIYYALKRYGIVIPFPIRTVQLHQGLPPAEEWKETYRCRLKVLAGRREGDFFPLDRDRILVGRGEDCDVDLRDPTTSKEHAHIVLEDGHYFVQDAASKHGTLVNGKPAERRKLRSGDEITIGESVLRFEEIQFL
jgi:small-conductance mechanosensitive channel